MAYAAYTMTEQCKERSSLELITMAAHQLNMDISKNSSKSAENFVQLAVMLEKMCANRTSDDNDFVENQTDMALLSTRGMPNERSEMGAFIPTAILCIICVIFFYMLVMLILMFWYMKKDGQPSQAESYVGEVLAGPFFWVWFYFCGSIEEAGDIESEDSSTSPDSYYEPGILYKTVDCEFPATTEKEAIVPPLCYTILTELEELLETETSARETDGCNNDSKETSSFVILPSIVVIGRTIQFYLHA